MAINNYIHVKEDGSINVSVSEDSYAEKRIANGMDLRLVVEETKHIDPTYTWDFGTNTYIKSVDIQTPARKLELDEFFSLFTESQFESIAGAANAKVKAFILKVRLIGSIDTESAYITKALNGLETFGLIEAGEANRILTDAQTLAGV